MDSNAWLNAGKPLIVAHRGASVHLPENTLAACALAEEIGADGVEVDVQLSKDGHPVLVHDSDLMRLTGNPRKVSELTIGELKQEDFGHGQTIALLDELFESLGDTIRYNIEIKDFGLPNRDLLDLVAEAVKQHSLESLTLISSFNPLVVRGVQGRFPSQVAVALLRAPGLLRHTNHFVDVTVDNPHFSLVDEDYRSWAGKRNLHTFAWTVDDVAEVNRLLALGVDGIITNDPLKLREHLDLEQTEEVVE